MVKVLVLMVIIIFVTIYFITKRNRFKHKNPILKDTFATPESESIKILHKHGYKPIYITQFMFEETFIFSTQEEATKAYNELEKDKELIMGWFYDEKGYYEALIDNCNIDSNSLETLLYYSQNIYKI